MPESSSVSKNSAQIELLKKELKAQQAIVAQLRSDNHKLRHHVKHQRIETVRAVMYSTDQFFRFTFTSPNVVHHTGLKPPQMLGQSLMDFIHPDDARIFKDLCSKASLKGPQTAILRFGTMGQTYQWMKSSVAPILNQAVYTGIQGVFIAIDKDKLGSNQTVSQNSKYRDRIENLQEGFFESNLLGRITYCNKALLTLFAYQPDELVGKKLQEVTSPRAARSIMVILGRMYKRGQKGKIFNHRIVHPSGRTLIIEFSVSLVLNAHGEPVGFQGILRNISEQMKASEKRMWRQDQLNHSRKMNALETLAGGLSHGINNVLMAIQGNLSLIRMNLSRKHPMQKNLERINQSAEKGNQLARELLSFAKIGKFVVMPTNLNDIIHSTCRMFIRSHAKLKIHEHLHDALWQTQVDRVQIGQALLSLYLHAVEAMPEGGNLYLQSENTTLDATYTRPYDISPGQYVKISITDSGIGLEDEAKERIFEPFFNAYRPLRYNGLGLAAAYGTIKSHQGIINVYSQKGCGSTFTLYLPAMSTHTVPAPLTYESATGVETILLVDDDELYSHTCREILERRGYRVMIASNGSTAIALYAKYKDKINLVLLDVILPDISGDHIFQEMKHSNPNATVIVVSGYNVNQQVSALLNQGCVDFIQKPFKNETLANKVRTALDRSDVPPAIAQLIS